MDEAILKELLEKYRLGKCSHEERMLLESWYLSLSEKDGAAIEYAALKQAGERIAAAIEQHTGLSSGQPSKPTVRLWPRIAAAASILLCCGLGLYVYQHGKTKLPVPGALAKNDVAPGRNRATLTLAGGQKIILTKTLNGKLAQQGTMLIRVDSAKEIAYTPGAAGKKAGTAYNTLSTAKGEQSPYPLVLADGTKVWLNAASSIRYPAAFTGNERRVEITGEVYFEVVHNAAKPFRVSFKGETLEDLGTHFDINAYDDEPAVKSTLLEGSARVSKAGQSAVLAPGQQAQVLDNHINLVSHINPGPVVAWKEGYFRFDDADMGTVMRQFSRWYDVEVVYEGQMGDHEFAGRISRNSSLQKVLKILALSGVHYRIEGKKLIVMP